MKADPTLLVISSEGGSDSLLLQSLLDSHPDCLVPHADSLEGLPQYYDAFGPARESLLAHFADSFASFFDSEKGVLVAPALAQGWSRIVIDVAQFLDDLARRLPGQCTFRDFFLAVYHAFEAITRPGAAPARIWVVHLEPMNQARVLQSLAATGLPLRMLVAVRDLRDSYAWLLERRATGAEAAWGWTGLVYRQIIENQRVALACLERRSVRAVRMEDLQLYPASTMAKVAGWLGLRLRMSLLQCTFGGYPWSGVPPAGAAALLREREVIHFLAETRLVAYGYEPRARNSWQRLVELIRLLPPTPLEIGQFGRVFKLSPRQIISWIYRGPCLAFKAYFWRIAAMAESWIGGDPVAPMLHPFASRRHSLRA